MGDKITKSPNIRFAGFTDAWEQHKLGEVLTDMYNGQTPYRLDEDNWNGDINWLSSGELNRGIVIKTVEKITPQGQKDANLKLIPKGTFVIAITGLEASGTRGNCAILGIDTTMNQSCMALFPMKEILDSKFLFQWYRKVGKEYGISYTQGTKQQSYNAEIIKLLPISLPSLEEQSKIAKCLFNLDNLITLHQRKLDLLKVTKKSMLQKMFPKDGESVPEIRFAGFTDPWEQRKLGDVFDFKYGEFNNNPDNGGEYPIYGANGIIGGYTKWNAENSSIIGHMGAYAGYVIWGEGKHFVTYNGTIAKTSNDFIDSKFGYYLLTCKQIYKICAGSGQPFVSYSDLSGIDIKIPDQIFEQRKIASYFSGLDNLIILHQRELDLLKDLKKSMLQQMFI